MNFKLLPTEEILNVLKTDVNPHVAFKKIIGLGQVTIASKIWDTFNSMPIDSDIEAASKWLNQTLSQYPKTKGIYLGLDTLNMDNGEGTNIEIGLSHTCKPKNFTADWIYECENYGDSHLIKGLYDVIDSFENDALWTDDERSYAEYIIFIGYSGVVLREALLNLERIKNFLSIWGFHDGDMFFLVQKLGDIKAIVTDIDMEEE
jgi:hypothetical protein